MPNYNQALRAIAIATDALQPDEVLLCAIRRNRGGGYVVDTKKANVESTRNQAPEVPSSEEVAPEVVPSAAVRRSPRHRTPARTYTFRMNGDPAFGQTLTYKKQHGLKAQAKKRRTRAKRILTLKAKREEKEAKLRAQGAREAKMKAAQNATMSPEEVQSFSI